MTASAPIPPPPPPLPPEGPAVLGAPRSGVYTNTSAAPQILLIKHKAPEKGTPPRYQTIKVAPGETFEVDGETAAKLEETAAFKTQAIKRGRHGMPAARAIALAKADDALALKFIAEETRVVTLREWLRSELRGPIREAILLRIKSLPGHKG